MIKEESVKTLQNLTKNTLLGFNLLKIPKIFSAEIRLGVESYIGFEWAVYIKVQYSHMELKA